LGLDDSIWKRFSFPNIHEYPVSMNIQNPISTIFQPYFYHISLPKYPSAEINKSGFWRERDGGFNLQSSQNKKKKNDNLYYKHTTPAGVGNP